ncbi:mediator of RNA polymerase II transcription subunit 1-like [Portunus trituberculatus]|uniref:mediator of RNA polymerase II transcription subunit 1-like n=1 Tax=Portunus trituberculatus TaxID=210409 RepID=UPI001E1CDC65|nr:mediator of RNA polymerase II transcription subunit 1-like [Portunus trituberculatus]
MSGGRHGEGRRRPPSELQGGGKKSGGGPSRTSRSGLLPSPVVWGNDAPQPSFLALLHNGGANLLLDGYDSGGGGGGGGGGRGRGGGAAARAALANGERSSDSEDSGATSGATSGKEASPGCEESSGSEQSSAPPHDDTRHDDDQSSPAPARSRAALPRSRTTPMLNGGRHAALDDALRPLTLYGPETGGGGLGRVRAAHEANMSKLAYLEALFTRAKLEEARLEGSREELRSRQPRPAAPRSLHSPETGYKTLPASCSDHALRGLAGGISTPALPDGHTLLRTIETRLQLARPREGGGAARGTLYQCGNSSSAGSLTHLASSGSPATSGASTPSRFLSPSRKEAPVSLASATSAGGGAPKRPDGLPARPAGHGSQHSLPHNYRSRSAYSSPAVSPQRGPDPGGFLTSPSGTAQRRFSSLELRGARGPSAPRQLPLRHTAHGFPSSGVALSPPSPAQGAQAFHRKMQLFFDIMETQSRFSQLAHASPLGRPLLKVDTLPPAPPTDTNTRSFTPPPPAPSLSLDV